MGKPPVGSALAGVRLGADVPERCPIFRVKAAGFGRKFAVSCHGTRAQARRVTRVRIAAIDRATGRWRDPMAHAPTPRRRLFQGGLLALLGLCWMALATPPAAAQSVEQFYKGRTITLYVASAPGGINDL